MAGMDLTRRALLTAAGAAGVGALGGGPEAAAQAGPDAFRRGAGLKTLFHVDPEKPMAEQAVPGHNR